MQRQDEPPGRRALWYKGPEFTLGTVREQKYFRGKLSSGGEMVVTFRHTSGGKTTVIVEQTKLSGEAEVAEKKVYWGERLDEFAAFIEA